MTTWTIDTGQIRHRVMIGLVDYSIQHANYQLTDSHIDQSGFVKTQGSIVFTRGAVEIDNWGLSAIPDGAAVTIDVWLDGRWQRHPRGALRAVGSQYSEIEQILTLEVGCILSARSFAEVPDVFLSGVTPGSSVGVQTVAGRLLNNGAPGTTIVNNATGAFSFLDRPQMSGSAIETAAKMLASSGAFCWVDSQERIVTTNIDLNPTAMIWNDYAYKFVSFERVKNGQPPTEEIQVTGSYREVYVQKNPVTIGPFREYAPSKNGGIQLQKEWESTTVIDFGGGVETSTTTSRINAEVVYRAWNAGGNGLVPGAEVTTRTRRFDKNDTAYLLSSIEVTNRERGLALGPFLDWMHKKDTNGFASAARYGSIPAETIEEIYDYDSQGFLISKETTKRGTLATLLGELGDPNWKIAKSLDMGQLVVLEKTVETWKEKIPGQWLARKTVWMPQGRAPSGRTGIIAAIEADKDNSDDGEGGGSGYVPAIIQAQQLMVVSDGPVDSNSGQSTPPAPERMPVQYKSESRGAESVAYFPSTAANWQPRRSTMQIPYLPDRHEGQSPPTESAQYYGRIYGGVQQAQWRTLRITAALDQWLIDGYRPWAPMNVFREGTIYTLAISGASWVGDREECLVSIDGALLGERQGAVVNASGVLTNFGTLAPPYLRRGADDTMVSVAEFVDVQPTNRYGDPDTMSTSASFVDRVTPQDSVTTEIGLSGEKVEQLNNSWIWFF